MSRVLITGANGFVANTLSETLMASGFQVRGSVRSGASHSGKLACSVVGDINAATLWEEALKGIDVVVHLAGRAHVMKETASDSMAAFRKVNTAGTENLALQCAAQGVKRFVYLSTIKVNGERAESEGAFSADGEVNPQGPYALSKWEAEQALRKIGAETGLEIVIIRPPLVYGPGVKGNLPRLLKWVDSGLPIPLARVNNVRSLVSLDNLCDFIKHCIEHPDACGETFLVSDSQALSTVELIGLMAESMQRPVRWLAVPVTWLQAAGKLCRRQSEIERLCGSLFVDTRKSYEVLGWRPPFSVEDGIQQTADWFLTQKR